MHVFLRKNSHLNNFFIVEIFISFTIFPLQTITSDSGRITVLCGYLGIPTIELLILTYLGNMITLQSSRIVNAIMNSPWYFFMMPIKRELLIMMIRGLKPLYFTAGKMFNLTIGLFISVSEL